MKAVATFTRPAVVSIWSSCRGGAVFNYAVNVGDNRRPFTLLVEESCEGTDRMRVFGFQTPEELHRQYRVMLKCLSSWLGECQSQYLDEKHHDWLQEQ